MKVSFFDGSIRNNQVTRDADLPEILQMIRGGYWADHVLNVRAVLDQYGKDSPGYKSAKENTPNITTSGTFDGVRRKDKIVSHSGFIDIDIDCYNSDPEAIKQKVIQFPFVAAAYLSVSGRGVCAVCHVDPVPEQHENFCNILVAYFLNEGVTDVDFLKDWSRARFISFDPGALIKDEFRALEPADIPDTMTTAEADPDELQVVDDNSEENEYYSHDECIKHAWQAVGRPKKNGTQKVWAKGQHYEYAKDFILYCNDLGVPEGKVLNHFKEIAPDYEDAKKLVRSYYRIAAGAHGSRRPLKKKYSGNGFTFQGQRGHQSYIPAMYDGHQVRELEQYDPVIDALRITRQKEFVPMPRLMKYGNGVVARPGDLVMFSGKSKSGKSDLIKKAAAGLMTPAHQNNGVPMDHLFGFWFGPNVHGWPVIIADTEQSDDDCRDTIDDIIKLSGRTEEPENFIFLSLKKTPTKQRAAIIARAIIRAHERFGGIYAVFIDGPADLLPDVNNVDDVNQLYDLLAGMAEKYLFPMFVVVHMNPTGFDKERGVLGSEFRRKCATLIRVAYDKELGGSWVTFELMRKGERGLKFFIRFDPSVGYFVRDKETERQLEQIIGIGGNEPLPDNMLRNETLYRTILHGLFNAVNSVPQLVLMEDMEEQINAQPWQEKPLEPKEVRNHVVNAISLGLIQPDRERQNHFVRGFKLDESGIKNNGPTIRWNQT